MSDDGFEPALARERAALALVAIGRSLYERGYVHASAGNLSARLADGILITPTDACLGTLDAGDLAFVDHAGVQRCGAKASKTLALHRRIYQASPEAGAIVHTHSTHLVAATLHPPWSATDLLPPITPYFVMKVGHAPLVPYHRPGDAAVADCIERLIRAHRARGATLRAVVLERLGPVVWHRSAAEAAAVLEELEETAHLWLLAGRSVAPLDDARIGELRQVFGVQW